MGRILTTVVLIILSPVLLTGQSVSRADKLITPSASGQALNSRHLSQGQEAFRDIRPSGRPIVLQASLGTLLHLSRAPSTVFVANEDVADVQVKEPEFIYVTAKKPGTTVLYAVDNAGNILLNKMIEVQPAPVQAQLVQPRPVTIIRGATVADAGQPAPQSSVAKTPVQPAAPPPPQS